MSISVSDLLLYVGALFILFLTPGPVWVALIARGLSGGFQAAWPLALGVVVGDILWPFLAILGVSWMVATFSGFMTVLRFVAMATFLIMGALLIRNAGKTIAANSRLTRPGMWAGFLAGVAVILGNPKAILFYMGVLPGFFDLNGITWADIGVIVLASILVPLLGNLILAVFVDRARALMRSDHARRRLNVVSGWLLVGVGCVIPFT